MSNHDSFLKISNWSKKFGPGLLALSAVLLMGQSCSISLGNSQVLDGGIWRSDDHGLTWQAKNFVRQEKKKTISISDLTTQTMVFRPNEPATMYLGSRGLGVWVSTDSGDHWQPTSLRAGSYPCIDFDPDNADILYTVSGTVAMKSINAGQEWKNMYTETQPGQIVNCVAVDPRRGNVIWLTTSGGKIVRSDDYGQTWRLQQTVPGFTPRRMLVTDGRIYVFTQTQGIFVVEPDGKTLTDLSPNLISWPGATDMRAVEIHSGVTPVWWIATAGGLLTSADRGATWIQIKTLVIAGSIAINTVAVNPIDRREIFITTDQKLHHSTDGGVTWTVSILPTSRLPILLTFTPDQEDRLFFATFRPLKK